MRRKQNWFLHIPDPFVPVQQKSLHHFPRPLVDLPYYRVCVPGLVPGVFRDLLQDASRVTLVTLLLLAFWKTSERRLKTRRSRLVLVCWKSSKRRMQTRTRCDFYSIVRHAAHRKCRGASDLVVAVRYCLAALVLMRECLLSVRLYCSLLCIYHLDEGEKHFLDFTDVSTRHVTSRETMPIALICRLVLHRFQLQYMLCCTCG